MLDKSSLHVGNQRSEVTAETLLMGNSILRTVLMNNNFFAQMCDVGKFTLVMYIHLCP